MPSFCCIFAKENAITGQRDNQKEFAQEKHGQHAHVFCAPKHAQNTWPLKKKKTSLRPPSVSSNVLRLGAGKQLGELGKIEAPHDVKKGSENWSAKWCQNGCTSQTNLRRFSSFSLLVVSRFVLLSLFLSPLLHP